MSIASFRAALYAGHLLLAFCLSATAVADAPAPKPVLSVPIQVSVPVPPSVFRGNGQRHLAYEIQMTNFSASIWTIQRIQVRSESGASLLAAEGKEIGSLLRHAAREEGEQSGEPRALAPGESVIAYMGRPRQRCAGPGPAAAPVHGDAGRG